MHTGGLCWGDSGGALLLSDDLEDPAWDAEEGWSLVGVASQFASGGPGAYCEVGNRLVFTGMVGERDFLGAHGVLVR